MAGSVSATCGEFRPDFAAYLAGGLGDTRRVLVEDHLGRCPACRTRRAEMKGERTVIAMPPAFARAAASQGTTSSLSMTEYVSMPIVVQY